MKILYVELSQPIRELISLTLKSLLGVDIKTFETGESLLSYIGQSSEEYLAIIYNLETGNDNALDLYNKIVARRSTVPFIITSDLPIEKQKDLSNFTSIRENNFYLQKPNIVTGLLEAIKAIGVIKEKKDLKYTEIPMDFLHQLPYAPVDIFVKASDKKYIKIINDGEQDFLTIVDNYKKKVKILHVNSSDLHEFYDICYSIFLKRLERDTDETTYLETQLSAVQFAHHTLKQLGFNEIVIDTARKTLASVIEMTNTIPALKAILKEIADDGGGVIYRRSIATSYIAIALSHGLRWSTELTNQKLGIAAIFHDSLLSEELIDMFELSDQKTEGVDRKKLEIYKNHPYETAKIIAKEDRLLPGIDKIIEQHHERPDGSGFPKGLTASSINHLSAIFIVSEKMAFNVVTRGLGAEVVSSTMNELKKDFNQGPFGHALHALEVAQKNLM